MEQRLEVLIDRNVFAVDGEQQAEDGAGEESFRLTDEFLEAVENNRQRYVQLSDEEFQSVVDEVVDDFDPDLLFGIDAEEPLLLAEYEALGEFADELLPLEKLRAVTTFDELRRGPPPADGAPETFVPLHGNQLEIYLQGCRRAIIYVWMRDCDPCDLVKGDFDEFFDEPPDDINLYAVHGPQWDELLERKYNVVGAPTVLFMVDGEPDTRLQGAYPKAAVENEIKLLRELTA